MGYYTNKRIVQLDFDANVTEDLSGMAKELILTSTEGCYIRINEITVTAVNGFYIPADTSITIPLTKPSSIAAIKETTAGKLTVLELF